MPCPQLHWLKLDSQVPADFDSPMMEILAKGRLPNDPSICSLHSGITTTSLLLLTELFVRASIFACILQRRKTETKRELTKATTASCKQS